LERIGVKFRESAIAHKYLDGLKGIEIGAAAHNPFGLNTINIDNASESLFKQSEIEMCGEAARIDIIAEGDDLPLADNSVDYVVSSHVLEHFPDPVKAMKEWFRVVRTGGYILAIVPHKDRTFDKDRDRTRLLELILTHGGWIAMPIPVQEHCSVWITEDVLEMAEYYCWPVIEHQDIDDKVGNGFLIVLRK